jgi:hypothetical protein
VIKIRYACLPEGLHATAVARGRHVTIYLRPGLDPEQRRDAVARLRRNARLGYAPPLPAVAVARAEAADRVSGTLRTLLAAVQCHPLGALGLAGVLAGAAVSYMTLMTYPLPAGSAAPAASLPAAGDGESAAAGQLGSGLPAAVVPLGIKPRPWTVPEARPRHHAQHRAAWPSAQPSPGPGGSRHGWWWPHHRPGWQRRLARHWGGWHHHWPRARHWRSHPWGRRHEPGRHDQGSQPRRDRGGPHRAGWPGRRRGPASPRQDSGWQDARHWRQAYGWRVPEGRPPAAGRPEARNGRAGYRRPSARWPRRAGQYGAPPQVTGDPWA